MTERHSIKLPVTLSVVMMVVVAVFIVGWTLVLSTKVHDTEGQWSPLYVTLLAVGTVLGVFILVGLAVYLQLSVRVIRLNQRQSNFVDSVTHELKSPIASLKLHLQTLSRRAVEEPERIEFYRLMLADVQRLDDLINQILTEAQLERPQPIGAEAVSIPELIQQCVATVCTRHRVSPDCVAMRLSPVTVKAPRVHLELIFRNLLDNALKYGGDPPQVTVTCEPRGADLIARIADNGPGIPAGHRRRVFERFMRIGNELERKAPGTGLGLHIVKALTRRLRGTVRVVDRQDGPGAEFQVSLPMEISPGS